MRTPRFATVFAVAVVTSSAGLGATARAAQTTRPAGVSPHGSIRQAYVLGARKGERLRLADGRGRIVATGRADRFGSKVFRDVRPGRGYTVRLRRGGATVATRPFKVLRAGENPRQSFYRRQKLRQGLNYVKMRDGVELAMTVRLPPGKTLADGPFPTLIEYSGYQTAAPHDLLDSVVKALTGGGGASDPLVPATSTAVGSLIGQQLGFAVVSVQMRGSGCSGGAFDLFDLPTTYDGYDAVETVAAQSWVRRRKVGLAGTSFSGITQLFVGGTQPPHLAAIAPMSVTDDLYTGTGYPGGIFNSGFAQSWIVERMENAEPAPSSGSQPYANELVRLGDRHCIANQKLRLQTQDALKIQKAMADSGGHCNSRSVIFSVGL
jgi:predicted acyl esterase